MRDVFCQTGIAAVSSFVAALKPRKGRRPQVQ
jgi:hypothetical protein